MTESAFPFSPPPEEGTALSPGESTEAGTGSRRGAVFALLGVLVLAVGVGAYFLLFAGGGHSAASKAVPVLHLKPKPAAVVPSTGSAPAAKPPAPQVPATFSDVVGRDPFKALYVAPAAAPASSSPAGTTPAGTTPAGTTPAAGTPAAGAPAAAAPATTASTAPAPAGQPASSTSSTGRQVSLIHVFAQNGRSFAQTKVDSTVYTPGVGDTFAGTFKLVSVQGSCATYLNGDERFDLCEGQQVLK